MTVRRLFTGVLACSLFYGLPFLIQEYAMDLIPTTSLLPTFGGNGPNFGRKRQRTIARICRRNPAHGSEWELVERKEDRQFIGERTVGWEVFRQRILDFPPSCAVELTGAAD
jgi:hypothetical protein